MVTALDFFFACNPNSAITLVPVIVLDVGQSTVTCPDVCAAVSVPGTFRPDRFTTSFPDPHCGIVGAETVIEQPGNGDGTGIGVAVGLGTGVGDGVGTGDGAIDGLGLGVLEGVGIGVVIPPIAAFNASMSQPLPK